MVIFIAGSIYLTYLGLFKYEFVQINTTLIGLTLLAVLCFFGKFIFSDATLIVHNNTLLSKNVLGILTKNISLDKIKVSYIRESNIKGVNNIELVIREETKHHILSLTGHSKNKYKLLRKLKLSNKDKLSESVLNKQSWSLFKYFSLIIFLSVVIGLAVHNNFGNQDCKKPLLKRVQVKIIDYSAKTPRRSKEINGLNFIISENQKFKFYLGKTFSKNSIQQIARYFDSGYNSVTVWVNKDLYNYKILNRKIELCDKDKYYGFGNIKVYGLSVNGVLYGKSE